MQLQEILKNCTQAAKSDQELAIKLHDYVRDHIRFGFTCRFDQADVSYTLERGMGHCNPKSHLLKTLFNLAGFESYQRFMLIKKHLLKGCLPFYVYQMLPAHISHSVTDIHLQGEWYSLDSYVMDLRVFQAAQQKLKEEEKSIGFGSHFKAACVWDGKSNAFSQAGESQLLVEDHGRIIDIDEYYRSPLYKNKLLGRPMSTWLSLLGPFGFFWEKAVNSVLFQMRK